MLWNIKDQPRTNFEQGRELDHKKVAYISDNEHHRNIDGIENEVEEWRLKEGGENVFVNMRKIKHTVVKGILATAKKAQLSRKCIPGCSKKGSWRRED